MRTHTQDNNKSIETKDHFLQACMNKCTVVKGRNEQELIFNRAASLHVFTFDIIYLEGRTAWGTKGVYAVSRSAASR